VKASHSLLLLLLLQGRVYHDSLYNGNYTADVPYTVQEGRGPAGGAGALLHMQCTVLRHQQH
jgi:hypothetical protein